MSSGRFPVRFSLCFLTALAGCLAAASAGNPAAARGKSSEAAEQASSELSGKAILAVISIRDQRISLYDSQGGAVRAPISSGQTEYETPVGVFSVLQKEVEHHSNLYDDASMPFMQRLTWTGVALHAGVLPGYPASHGCVRLPQDFARRIFSLTKVGMRVVISADDVAPVDIAHPKLPAPQPVGAVATALDERPADADPERETAFEPDVRRWPARQALLDKLRAEAKSKAEEAKTAAARWEAATAELGKHAKERALVALRARAEDVKRKAEARVAKAERAYAAATAPNAQRRAEKEKDDANHALVSAQEKFAEAAKNSAEAETVIQRLKDDIAAAEAAKTAAAKIAGEAKRKTMPMSVFVSTKSRKLYIRQGNEPVYETQIEIANSDRPIGTHVFTALDYAGDGNEVHWNVVTISTQGSETRLDDEDFEDGERHRHGRKKKVVAPPKTDEKAAAAALERLSITAEVRARISQYVWPGSSLILSDEEIAAEGAKGTDFIVVDNDEPHGALTMRAPQPPRTYEMFADDDRYDRYYRYSRRPDLRYMRPRAPYKSLFSWW